MRSTQRGGLIALAATVAFAFTTSKAHASGYLTARFGSDHGTPAAPNPYAVYYNPAALGGMKGTQIVGDLSLGIRTVTYDRSADALTPSNPSFRNNRDYIAANFGRAKLLNVVPLPFLGAASDLGTKNLRVGYALYVPFGGLAEWNRKTATDYAPGAVEGPQRWHNISGQILAIYNTAAIAYRFPDARVSIGANFSAIYHHAETVRARNIDGSDDIRLANGALKEGRSYINVTGLNFAAALGVYWDPTDDLKLGLSYTSQPGFGTTRMSGTLEQQFGTDPTRAAKTNVDLLQTYPDIIRLGAGYRTTRTTEVRFDFEYVRWSVFKRQCLVNEGKHCNVNADGSAPTGSDVILNIPRDWKDAIGARLGGAWWPMEALELFGSVSMTTSAVPKETIDPSTIDSTRFYLALGGRYELSRTLALAASYNPIYFVPVDTKGANKHDQYAQPSRSPSADGKYSSMIHLFNVNATVSF